MSYLLARILLSVALFPLALLFDAVLFLLTRERINDYFFHNHAAMWICNGTTAVLMCLAWWAIWNGFVRRTFMIVVALGPALVGGAAIFFAIAKTGPDRNGIVLGCLAMPVLWMFATIFIWRARPLSAG